MAEDLPGMHTALNCVTSMADNSSSNSNIVSSSSDIKYNTTMLPSDGALLRI